MDAITKVATAAMMKYQNRLKSTDLSILVKEKNNQPAIFTAQCCSWHGRWAKTARLHCLMMWHSSHNRDKNIYKKNNQLADCVSQRQVALAKAVLWHWQNRAEKRQQKWWQSTKLSLGFGAVVWIQYLAQLPTFLNKNLHLLSITIDKMLILFSIVFH